MRNLLALVASTMVCCSLLGQVTLQKSVENVEFEECQARIDSLLGYFTFVISRDTSCCECLKEAGTFIADFGDFESRKVLLAELSRYCWSPNSVRSSDIENYPLLEAILNSNDKLQQFAFEVIYSLELHGSKLERKSIRPYIWLLERAYHQKTLFSLIEDAMVRYSYDKQKVEYLTKLKEQLRR